MIRVMNRVNSISKKLHGMVTGIIPMELGCCSCSGFSFDGLQCYSILVSGVIHLIVLQEGVLIGFAVCGYRSRLHCVLQTAFARVLEIPEDLLEVI